MFSNKQTNQKLNQKNTQQFSLVGQINLHYSYTYKRISAAVEL